MEQRDHIRLHPARSNRTPTIVDCDPGIDDAVALALVAASPEFDLRAVTTVTGNVTVDLSTRNAVRTLAACGRPEVPVAAGASRPLVRTNPPYAPIHGLNGLGEVELPAAGPDDLGRARDRRLRTGARARRARRGHGDRPGAADQPGAPARAAARPRRPDRPVGDDGDDDRPRQRHPVRRVQRLGRSRGRLPGADRGRPADPRLPAGGDAQGGARRVAASWSWRPGLRSARPWPR